MAAGASVWLCSASFSAPAIDQPPTWASLNAAQRRALAPLQHDWAEVDSRRKEKWLEVASRYAAMPRDEQTRIQARMTDWLKLSPTERARARLQFQEVRQVPADERQERWRAYQALSPEERSRLAKENRAAAQRPAVPTTAVSDGSAAHPQAPSPGALPPIAIQARPGATTNTSSARPRPPLHHQAGLPKIAATPGFVDPATLLPKRGPQGAAVRSAKAVEPAASAASAARP